MTPWVYREGKWQASVLPNPGFAARTILGVAPENPGRTYLRTCTVSGVQFYQLALLPPLAPGRRKPKSVLLAIDVTYPGEKVLDFGWALGTFMEATRLSLSPRDSIALVYSSFTPVVPDSDFGPATPELIDQMEHTVALAGPPMLNTLPHLLRTAVRLFNRRHRGGEIWLLTDARTHASPRASAMDIIAQTHGAAEHPVTFNIISDDAGYGYLVLGMCGERLPVREPGPRLLGQLCPPADGALVRCARSDARLRGPHCHGGGVGPGAGWRGDLLAVRPQSRTGQFPAHAPLLQNRAFRRLAPPSRSTSSAWWTEASSSTTWRSHRSTLTQAGPAWRPTGSPATSLNG
ncbi:MAG: hypothetical protein ACUVTG_12120 [Candidatus Oleimicrobiaceae bacterium]